MNSNDLQQFATRIAQLRIQRGLTPQQLAEQIGLTEQTVQHIEGARQRPSRDVAERLADALYVPATERDHFVQLAVAYDPAEITRLTERGNAEPRSLEPFQPPRPTVDLIGRDRERTELVQHLRARNHRLVTLVGPGGMGKTSLALHLTAELANDPTFPDGVAMVWLASVLRPNDVPSAIANALAIALHGARPVADQLIDALYDRALLLVLDNVEHLLNPDDHALTGFITRLLGGAPNLRLLVTSRERLRLRDEWVVELGGLTVPTSDHGSRMDQAEAVQLFLDRARQVAPAFMLTSQNRAAVAHMCRRLEGLPLAIELAATWVRALSPAEIASEIDRSLDLLTLTHRDMPARHQSMRAAFDHSWNLLDDNERCTLARLSVFKGGCEREAAREITGATLPTITALLDKSLLRAETADGITRYRLHPLVRQYAAERLAANPDDQRATEQRHTQYYAALIERVIDPQTGGSTPEGQATLNRNIDNFRAAWENAVTGRNAAVLGMMMRPMWLLYDHHAWLHDGVTLFRCAANALRDVAGAAVVRGHLLGIQSYMLGRVNGFQEAREAAEESLSLLRANGSTDGLAAAMMYYGISLYNTAHLRAANDQFAEAAEYAHALGDRFTQVWCETWLASIATFWGEYDTAERYTRACLETFRAYGNSRGEGISVMGLGELARLRGQFDTATAHLHEGLRLASATNDTLTILLCLAQLGAVALDRGELDEARYLLIESAALAREMGDLFLVGRALPFLARVEVARGDVEAARLACAELGRIVLDGYGLLLGDALFSFALLLHATGNDAEAWPLLHEFSNVEAVAELKPRAARLTAALQQRLDRAQQTAALEAAQHRQIEPWLRELTTRTFTQLPANNTPANIVQTGGVQVQTTGETLSTRELDVLRLIAAGANNADIAKQLVISLHTVKTHVAHILAKLHVASRTAAAVQARELGLV